MRIIERLQELQVAEQFLTIRETAQRLGLREKTIRRWVALRKIEYIKAGERAVRIPSTEIDRVIEAGRVPRLKVPARSSMTETVAVQSEKRAVAGAGGASRAEVD